MEASSSVFTFVAANADDNNTGTYWESNGYPATLTARLGANADINTVVVKLNPDPIWQTRTQSIQVLGRAQGASGFTSLKARADYTFNPASNQNSVTIPVAGRIADVQLQVFSNTGAPGGQVAEFQAIGAWAPNPDLVVTAVSWSPAAPTEATAVTVSATVRNAGTAAAGGDHGQRQCRRHGRRQRPGRRARRGASTTVSVNAGRRAQGSYAVSATVDPANTFAEQNNDNNSFTAPAQLVVAQAPGPDLEVTGITSNPPNPAVGAAVTFGVSVHNRGTSARGGQRHPGDRGRHHAERQHGGDRGRRHRHRGDRRQLDRHQRRRHDHGDRRRDRRGRRDERDQQRRVPSPSWSVAARRCRTSRTRRRTALHRHPGGGGRAAHLRAHQLRHRVVRPQVGPAHQAGPVRQFTSTNPANSIVVRNSIPDAPGGGGTTATISLYANDQFVQKLTLSSRNSWLYGTTDDTECAVQLAVGRRPPAVRRVARAAAAVVPGRHPVQVAARQRRQRGVLLSST